MVNIHIHKGVHWFHCWDEGVRPASLTKSTHILVRAIDLSVRINSTDTSR